MKANALSHGKALIVAATAVAAILIAAALLYAFEPWNAEEAAAHVEPKASLDDYSWEELAAIASFVSSAENETDAMRIAATYGLCTDEGALFDQVKTISLASGATASVRLVGIWHDERADGGKAGLTFAFADCPDQHGMNHAFERADGVDADNVGGWGASDMRSWLNGTFAYELPADLRNRIVRVQKRTASRPSTLDELDEPGRLSGSGVDWTTETSDSIWLFSAVELCGDIPVRSDLGIDSTMASMYASEGRQYRLFADSGVCTFEPNAALSASSRACTWWLRTKTLEFGDSFWLVGTDGTPLNGLGEDVRVIRDPSYAPDKLWGPDHERGVIAGFCL